MSVLIFAFNGVLAFTAAVVPVIAFGIYSKSQSKAAAFTSAIAALVAFYSMVLFKLTAYHTNPMIPGMIAIGIGLLTFALVAAFDRNPKPLAR